MRVLLDSCVAAMATGPLRDAGHDVVWAGDWPLDPGDDQVLRAAIEQSRVLVTIDKDFGELVIVHDVRHAGLVRLVGFRARDQADAIERVFAIYATELSAGALLTVEPWRVRVRPAP